MTANHSHRRLQQDGQDRGLHELNMETTLQRRKKVNRKVFLASLENVYAGRALRRSNNMHKISNYRHKNASGHAFVCFGLV